MGNLSDMARGKRKTEKVIIGQLVATAMEGSNHS